MPTTPNGVRYTIRSYHRTNAHHRSESTMVCLVDWPFAAEFMEEFLGSQAVAAAGSDTPIARKIPQRDPFLRWMVCVACELSGIGFLEESDNDGVTVPSYVTWSTAPRAFSAAPGPGGIEIVTPVVTVPVPVGQGELPPGPVSNSTTSLHGGASDSGTEGGDEQPRRYDSPATPPPNPLGQTVAGRAEISCRFEGVEYDVRTDAEAYTIGRGELSRYIIRQTHAAMEAQTINNPGDDTQLKFRDATGTVIKLGQQPVQINPLGEHTMTWVNVPKVPTGAITQALGTVNDTAFDDTFAATTLLFQGARITPARSHFGDLSYTIEYKFLERRIKGQYGLDQFGDFGESSIVFGWNHFRAPDGKYYIVTSDPSGDPADLTKRVYKQSDFNKLFNFSVDPDVTAASF